VHQRGLNGCVFLKTLPFQQNLQKNINKNKAQKAVKQYVETVPFPIYQERFYA
jgi:hypothetical protein